MSSAEVHLPFKPQGQHKNQTNIQSTNNNMKGGQNEKLRKRLKHDRNVRRRSKSFSGHGINPKPVLPSKFLLGGNINDPLNLNSLQDEEINRAMNAVTPKSSPIPTPPRRKGQVEVIIPPNIRDPLNLIDCSDDAEYELQLCSPVKKGRKKRLKKKRTISTTTEISDTDISPETDTPECQAEGAKIPDEPVPEGASASAPNVKQPKPAAVKDLTLELLSPKKDKQQKRKSEEFKEAKKVRYSLDKIVSPVVPQPGAWLKRMNSVTKKSEPKQIKEVVQMPTFKEKDKKFQFGNYNRYYGYRNQNNEIDHRLKVFSHHPFLFQGKDILDIGCNIGHVTLSIARDFGAKSVIGIDIDDKLISVARKNVKHYVKSVYSPRADEVRTPGRVEDEQKSCSEFFPISMPILYGPIDVPGFEDCSKNRGFPKNVTFKRCNYVLDDDTLLALEQPQYDTILCLSVTKWIHLNWGDNGLKQAFRRMYAQLRPGGRLVLEPQNWPSYKGKKKLTEKIFRNYNSIEFFPNKFTEYLLSPAVGFAKSEILGYPQCHMKGFRRPIQLFTKSTMFPSERMDSTPFNITPNMKSESQNSDSVDYIYSGILNRYCASSEENVEANNQIGKNLMETESKNTTRVLNSCDSSTDSLEKQSCVQKVEDKASTVTEIEEEKKHCDIETNVVSSSTNIMMNDMNSSNSNEQKTNCDDKSTVKCESSEDTKGSSKEEKENM